MISIASKPPPRLEPMRAIPAFHSLSRLSRRHVRVVCAAVSGASLAALPACFSSNSSGPADASFDLYVPDRIFGDDGGEVDANVGDVTLDAPAPEASVTDSGQAPVDSSQPPVDSSAPIDSSAPLDSSTPVDAGPMTGVISPAGATTWPAGIVVVGNDLYWMNEGDNGTLVGSFVWCTPSDGNCGTPSQLLSALPDDSQIASDGTTFFYSSGSVSSTSTDNLRSCPTACTSAKENSPGGIGFWDDITGVAVDANYIYYAAGIVPATGSNFGVYFASKSAAAGGTLLVGGLAPTANIAIDATTVYYSLAGGGIYTCPIPAADAGAFPPPCTPTFLQATGSTSGLAVDGTSIYWGDPVAGAVYRCPLAGCGDAAAPTPIATSLGHVNSLAIGGSLLFYTVGQSADGGAANGVFAAMK
jgi:hypothetical protein